MNRKRKIYRMRKFIRTYGIITEEYKRPPEPFYPKGSYFVNFQSERLDMNCCVGHIDKYQAYKSIIDIIKEYTK